LPGRDGLDRLLLDVALLRIKPEKPLTFVKLPRTVEIPK